MKRFLTAGILASATMMSAAPVLALGAHNNGVIPEREYELNLMPATTTDGEQMSIATDRAYEPRAAALINQDEVNRYDFGSDDERTASAYAPENRYR